MGVKPWKEIRKQSPLSDAQRAEDDEWARRELERLQAAERELPMARARGPKGGPKD